MMEAADKGRLNDSAQVGRMHRSRFRGVLVQGEVRPDAVVVRNFRILNTVRHLLNQPIVPDRVEVGGQIKSIPGVLPSRIAVVTRATASCAFRFGP